MAFLILSDIHSNLEALEAVLEDARGNYDHILCLGDVVGYGADPNAVTEWARGVSTQELLASAPITEAVRGNHDRACSGMDDLEQFNPAARAAALWSRHVLTEENRLYLEEMPSGPLGIRYAEDGDAGDPDDPSNDDRVFDLVHGSPLDEDQYVSSLADAVLLLEDLDRQITFFGHTHIQGGFLLTPDTVTRISPVPRGDVSLMIELEADCFYLINPGSVGQPRDRDSRASYAIYVPENHTVEYRRVAYDIQGAAAKIRAAGLPEVLAARLYQGA